jgi:ubiquinone/menaquinone biosynthesis C-methylase UbiE
MGEQIHIGGFASSMDLADRAEIQAGQEGVDFCCASGAGMRFLLRFCQAARMTGVDATGAMIELGRQRCEQEGSSDRVTFVEADVCASGLSACQFDFVWGEDAWCYVEDKPALIGEGARLLKPQGKFAFTDWMEGPAGLTTEEAQRYLGFMKFPNVLSLDEYAALLKKHACSVLVAQDTGRFASHAALYIEMLEKQLTYDALKIIGFDSALAESLLGEMRFLQSLAEAGKIMQGLMVAQRNE